MMMMMMMMKLEVYPVVYDGLGVCYISVAKNGVEFVLGFLNKEI